MCSIPFCVVALGAVADRRVRTPTSVVFSTAAPPSGRKSAGAGSTTAIGTPSPPRPHDLARQWHEGVHERLELQPQHPAFLRDDFTLRQDRNFPAATAPTTPSGSRPRPSSPCRPNCSPGCPPALAMPAAALQLGQEVLLVAAIVGTEDDLIRSLTLSLVM